MATRKPKKKTAAEIKKQRLKNLEKARRAKKKKANAKSAAAKKAAATRKKNATKRSAAAKKAATTRKRKATKRSTTAKKAAAKRKPVRKKNPNVRAGKFVLTLGTTSKTMAYWDGTHWDTSSKEARRYSTPEAAKRAVTKAKRERAKLPTKYHKGIYISDAPKKRKRR